MVSLSLLSFASALLLVLEGRFSAAQSPNVQDEQEIPTLKGETSQVLQKAARKAKHTLLRVHCVPLHVCALNCPGAEDCIAKMNGPRTSMGLSHLTKTSEVNQKLPTSSEDGLPHQFWIDFCAARQGVRRQLENAYLPLCLSVLVFSAVRFNF